jgi:hypothetical protein
MLNMSTRLVTKRDINSALEERFDSTTTFIYKTVIVLLLYWKDTDLDFKSEADQLEHLFRKRFKYEVVRFEIPSENSGGALNDEIGKVTRIFSTRRSLIIIHYGGHGDPDEDRLKGQAYPPQKCVWAAKKEAIDNASLNWSCIQPQLELGKGDFLVILDCCFGAQAARSSASRVIPLNVELLAAAPMGCQTTSPGPSSFTSAFIKTAESGLERQSHIDVSEMYHELSSGDKPLIQTPVHFPHGTQATIRLQPHLSDSKATDVPEPETILVMEMIVRGSLDSQLLDRVLRWLVKFVPPEVAGLKVTELVRRVTAAQNLLVSTASESRTVLNMDSLPSQSRSEMKGAWTAFSRSLRDNLKWLLSSGGSSDDIDQSNNEDHSSDELKLRHFLQTFDDNIALLASTLERNILAIPELLEEVHVKDALQDNASKDMGLVRSLQMRLENLRFEAALQNNLQLRNDHFLDFRSDSIFLQAGSLIEELHPKFGRVLVEYSYYAIGDTDVQRRNDSRMDHLVKILTESGSDFNTPTCLGWTAFRSKERYGLIFRNPYQDGYRSITLYDVLARPVGNNPGFARPTLGQRYQIAQIIGQTMLKWHNVGWVHQSISSMNIIFSMNNITHAIDYSMPYLCGFSFSRITSHHSTHRQGMNDILRDVYQHPERQGGTPIERHAKEHDIYSFGVLLFEIGFWARATDLFSKLVQRGRVSDIRGKMLSRVGYLGPEMGTTFASATRLSLGQDFGIQEDDKVQSRLARMFEHKVLRKLDVGTRLDD